LPVNGKDRSRELAFDFGQINDQTDHPRRRIVCCGYSVFLKQRWLSSSANLPTVVPISNWLDATPRVTKDVDVFLGLDLIKDASYQKSVVSALTQHGFEASDRPN
jgi:hypothetical protein